MEHSLAARGLKSRGYLYHGTKNEFFENIKVNGLDPRYNDLGEIDEPLPKYLYLGKDFYDARVFGSIVLRVDTEDLERIGILEFDEERDAWRFDDVIPPEFIEIEGQDGKWRKLKE